MAVKLSDFQYTLYDQQDRIPFLKQLIAKLGNPDKNFKIIHVAGTNGKGSTATMISKILSAHGYKVGLFTSPHIISECECISINGQQITPSEITTNILKIKKVITNDLGLDMVKNISQFEILLVVSLLFFDKENVDYAILECGLGGATDATNAITASQYEIFTHIALDHIKELGNTLEKITLNKAGIIRENSNVIVAPHQKDVVKKILTKQTQKHNSKIFFATNPPSHKKIYFSADYQYDNFATVLKFFEIFDDGAISPQECIRIINNFQLNGRFETLSQSPHVILDCAHNPDGITRFVETVTQRFKNKNKIIITGFLKDKNPHKCIDVLASLDAHFIVTTPENGRKCDASDLFKYIRKMNYASFELQPQPLQAYQAAINQSDEDTVIFIVGSFYLARPILNYLRKGEK